MDTTFLFQRTPYLFKGTSFLFRRILYLIFFILPMLSWSAEIDRVVQSAFQKSWEMENANYLKQNSIDEYTNKKRSFLPTVYAKTNHGFQGNNKGILNARVSEYSIEAKSILFSMAQFDDISLTAKAQDKEDLKFQEKKNKFCSTAANFYLSYLLEKKKNSNLSHILQILNKQFDVTSSEYRQGLKPRKDYLRLRTELKNTELEQLGQSVDLKSAEDSLRDKIGADFVQYAFDPASLEVPVVTAFEDEQEKDSILEKSLEKELDFLKVQKAKAKHELWPLVTLGAAYKFGDKEYWNGANFSPNRNDNWSLTLGLEYNIWDWGAKRRTQDEAVRTSTVRENEVYQEMRNAQNALDLARQKLRVTRRVYTAQSQLLGDERESFGLISRDYREGRITFLDYVSSLRSFGKAELSVFEGLVELNKAYFDILLHKGKLDEYFKL